MRACARVMLVSFALSAGLGLAGCDSIDSLTDTVTGLFDTKKKLPGDRKPVFPEGVPGVTPGVPPEYQPSRKDPAAQGAETSEPAAPEAETQSEKKDKPAPKPQRPQTAQAPKKPPPPGSVQPVQPQTAAPQTAPAQASPAQPLWPAPPASGTFSR